MATIQDVLTEGIRFFKDSKKLYKLALKIENKYHKTKDEETRNNLKQIVEKIRSAGLQFEKLENLYSKNKFVSKEEYKTLRRHYEEIFEYIKKQNIKKILISLGIFSAIAGAIIFSIEKLDKFLVDNNVLLVKGKGTIPGITTAFTLEGTKKMVARICKEQNISFKLISSLIDKESEWNPNAINHNNNGTTDYGLMQLNSSNKKLFSQFFWDKKEKFDMKNIEHNAYVGIKFFKSLLEQYKGDVKKALSAYNAGSGAVARNMIPDSTLHYRSDIIKNFKS